MVGWFPLGPSPRWATLFGGGHGLRDRWDRWECCSCCPILVVSSMKRSRPRPQPS